MPKFFIKNDQIDENKIEITGKDVNHISNVLRLNLNEKINIGNIDTKETYVAEIMEINKDKVICNILEKNYDTSESSIDITIFQGLPKADKMELIIQKSTELGVKEIVPVEMERCIVKLDEKSKKKKVDRWQKIAESAAKQSRRNIIPKISDIINYKKIYELLNEYDIVILLYENEEKNTLKSELKKLKSLKNAKIAIVIGPEGGFEGTEVEGLKQRGAKIITLGKRILRTETVSLAIISIIMYELGDLGGK